VDHAKIFLSKGKNQEKFLSIPDAFFLGALCVERFTLHLHLWSAFNGPDWANVRASPAVRAKGGIYPGMLFSGGYGIQGTNRQAVPAVGAFFSNLVGHFLNAEWGIRNAE
jgi:hypothetical protein